MQASAAILMLTAGMGWAEPTKSETTIKVDSVLVTLIEQVRVTAREVGILTEINVSEGQMVDADAVLARIDDSEAKLDEIRAKLELDIAREQAQSDIDVRFARKSWEVAKAELKRAQESVKKFKKSVSETEIDQLRLSAERAELQIEQAQLELKTAQLTWKLKANAHELARRKVERRKIVAPIAGVVVQINRKRGEWVQPSDNVIRILRVDRLRAEGFLHANQITGEFTGRPVILKVDLPGRPGQTFPGKLVFVSPEVNPVNGQVRIWAEIENRDRLLRPGLKASMEITPAVAKTAQTQSPKK